MARDSLSLQRDLESLSKVLHEFIGTPMHKVVLEALDALEEKTVEAFDGVANLEQLHRVQGQRALLVSLRHALLNGQALTL
ncbi:hypothetical protein [Piscinibacter gummiphilus]|uniref:Uncharacterized protein n=1 Tax=Piscinibacter gummiphilus TaxID=946333 RepID=A0ABZ0CNL4_9BURK|nr:hypothetical protein [Piscinibacter gummiphilus]WOB06474.1 hypothetical protein RXV79_16250 [Piscinibacter gummiphilus]